MKKEFQKNFQVKSPCGNRFTSITKVTGAYKILENMAKYFRKTK